MIVCVRVSSVYCLFEVEIFAKISKFRRPDLGMSTSMGYKMYTYSLEI